MTIELLRRPRCPARIFRIKQPHDQLRWLGVGRIFPLIPLLPKIVERPPGRDQAVETLAMPQHGLDGVVGQIMPHEKPSLLCVLPLVDNRAIGSLATERATPVPALF